MKVQELIELLESKPKDLEVYLQDFEGNPIDGRKIFMSNLTKSEVAVMWNGNTHYLAIGYTCDGVARADGSEIINVD